MLIVAMVLLLWLQIVLFWHQVTTVASEQHLYQTQVQFDKTIVLPRILATGSIQNYLFCYSPLVDILFKVLRINIAVVANTAICYLFCQIKIHFLIPFFIVTFHSIAYNRRPSKQTIINFGPLSPKMYRVSQSTRYSVSVWKVWWAWTWRATVDCTFSHLPWGKNVWLICWWRGFGFYTLKVFDIAWNWKNKYIL